MRAQQAAISKAQGVLEESSGFEAVERIFPSNMVRAGAFSEYPRRKRQPGATHLQQKRISAFRTFLMPRVASENF